MATPKKSPGPRIGVVGLWHLGCVISAAWSEAGLSVTGLDPRMETVENLARGVPPIFEPGLEKALKKNLSRKTLRFTARLEDLASCDFVFLAYDTPVRDDDSSDLTPLENSIRDLGKVLKGGAVVVVSSQTPVGTCLRFRRTLRSLNADLDLAYSPENLRLGEAIENYLRPGRVILGAENPATEKKVRSLFKRIPAEILAMNLSSAEMVKHGINAFLSTSITFTNALADLCEVSGAEIADVVRGMKSDPRIGPGAYLSPGVGFSGGTLGRDLKVLESLAPGPDNFFGWVHARNAARKAALIEKLRGLSPQGLRGRRLGILGLTYKPGTSTLRRSLPVELAQLLSEEGAQVLTYDPKADYSEWGRGPVGRRSPDAESLVRGSEVVLLLTEWPEFRDLDWKKLLNARAPQTIFDAKNFLADLALDRAGYRYIPLGSSRPYAQ